MVHIIVKDQKITEVLEGIADAFKAVNPEQYKKFLKYVEDESECLVKRTGMSKDGSMLNFMKIPCVVNSKGTAISLYAFIREQMQKRCGIDDFFRDNKNYQLMCKIWKNAAIKRESTQLFEGADLKNG